jgi:hypothetical protein
MDPTDPDDPDSDPDPQHWLGESDSTGVICTVMDGPHRLPCRTVPVAPDRSCPADGISAAVI